MDKILSTLLTFQARFLIQDDERGATATEYALLVALIAVVIVGGITIFGGALNTFFSGLSTKVGL